MMLIIQLWFHEKKPIRQHIDESRAMHSAPIWSGIKNSANVPVRPAVNTQNINMVPCIVTNAKYIFGSKTPPGAHFSPKNHSNTKRFTRV